MEYTDKPLSRLYLSITGTFHCWQIQSYCLVLLLCGSQFPPTPDSSLVVCFVSLLDINEKNTWKACVCMCGVGGGGAGGIGRKEERGHQLSLFSLSSSSDSL